MIKDPNDANYPKVHDRPETFSPWADAESASFAAVVASPANAHRLILRNFVMGSGSPPVYRWFEELELSESDLVALRDERELVHVEPELTEVEDGD